MPSYEITKISDAQQMESSKSHIGGYPNIPPNIELPVCTICHSKLTFFFQIAFPEKHDWFGKVMSIFSCTCCASKEHSPEIANNRIFLEDNFLKNYQIRFRIIVSDTMGCEIRKDYIPLVKYCKLEFKPLKNPNIKKTKIGGKPYWYLNDDTPNSYMGNTFTFLLQTLDDWSVFKKLPEAPPQVKFSFMFGMTTRNDDMYDLFYGLPLYFFGTTSVDDPQVYVLNQK